MPLYLKSPTDIQAIISGSAFAAVDTPTKTNLAAHFQVMPSSQWQATYNVLVAALPAAQAGFVEAIFTDVPPGGTTSVTITAPSGFAATISSVGDGAVTSLERVPTVGLGAPALRTIDNVAADEEQDWLLEYSSTSTVGHDDAGNINVIPPADFDPVNNAKTWFRKR